MALLFIGGRMAREVPRMLKTIEYNWKSDARLEAIATRNKKLRT